MSKRKLAVIALDGAEPSLIEQWTSEGHLPHIKNLIDSGSFGPLTSVIPPVTGAAWGSFVTGVYPGRHGIYEWLRRGENTYRLNLVNSSALPHQTLFEWLSQHNVRVGAISVPLSYPLRDINGFMVSDLLTPPSEAYTTPPELQEEIESELGQKYPLAPPAWLGRPRADQWFSALKESMNARSRATKYLASSQEWDFFMVHIMETDSVQHQMWQELDNIKRKRYKLDMEGQNPILEIYKKADDLIGELVDNFDNETQIMIISDHGFGSHLYNLHLNTWLLNRGFLKLKKNLSTRLKKLCFSLGLAPENLYPWEENLRLLGKASSGGQAYDILSKLVLSTQNIDWSNTVAYSYGNVGQIYLNRTGREPEGIVNKSEEEQILQQLESELKAWTNPETGEKVISGIHRKHDVYTEEALKSAPDLVFLPTDGYSPMGLSEFLSNREITHPVAHSGWHRSDGIFIGHGNAFEPGPKENLRLIDLFSVICRTMDVPNPDCVDSVIPESLLTPEVMNSQLTPDDEATTSSSSTSNGNQRALTAEEEEELRERLKGLGYL